jgi:hypothetical protein
LTEREFPFDLVETIFEPPELGARWLDEQEEAFLVG